MNKKLMAAAKALVEKHVLVDQTMLVEVALIAGWFDEEDAENLYEPVDLADLQENFPDEWALWSSAAGLKSDVELECLTEVQQAVREWWMWADADTDEVAFAQWLVEEADADWLVVFKRREISGWYIVSEWLLHKLLFRNEVILNNELGEWWGRGSGGQPAHADEVILEIAKEEPNES